MKEYFVYIVECRDGSYYTGITNDYRKRLLDHNEGIDPQSYTFRRRPVSLMYVASFREVSDAISWEKRVKGWSRKKKEQLILANYECLPFFSRNQYRRRIDIARVITHNEIYSTIYVSH